MYLPELRQLVGYISWPQVYVSHLGRQLTIFYHTTDSPDHLAL